MGLLSKVDLAAEVQQKKSNHHHQFYTNILLGKGMEWLQSSDASNRHNIRTSRCECLRSSILFGIVGTGMYIYLIRDTIPNEALTREDYEPLAKLLEEATLKDFLIAAFGSPTEVNINDKLSSLGEEYLFYLNVEPTAQELKDFIEKIEATDLSTREIVQFFVFFELYNEDVVSKLYKTVEDKYSNIVINATRLDKLSEDEIKVLDKDLTDCYKFWSFLIPKMKGEQAEEFKNLYRKFFVPTKHSKGKVEIPKDLATKKKALASALACLSELILAANTLLNPFPGFEKVAYKEKEVEQTQVTE